MKKKIVLTILLFYIFFLSILLFCAPYKIEIYGNSYLSNVTNIYLSKTDNLEEDLEDKFAKFKKLKEVNFGDNYISLEAKEELINRYPNINFYITSMVDINGLKVKDNVNRMDLNNVKINNNLIDDLKKLPNLKEIDFKDNKIDKKLQLSLIENYPNINFIWNVEVLDTVVKSDIESLDLDGKKVTDLDDFISSLKLLKNLKKLNMGTSNLSNEELGNLREILPNIRIDWTIYFGKWHINTDDVAFSVLISNFPYTRLTSEDLSFLKYCTELQALDLGHQKITDISVIADNLPNLRVLILADNKITDITPLSKLKHLHYLELFINKITDISPLKDNKELVDLNLCYNYIKDYSSLLNLPKLERLWLVGTSINEKDYNNLKEKYPNSVIVKYGKGSTGNGWRSHSRYHKMIDMFHKRNYISEEFTKYDD